MATDLDQLVDMGFDPEKAMIAVKKGGSLTAAIDWLDKNGEKSIEELQEEDENADAPSLNLTDADSNSLVCNDCGKKFRNTETAEFHAQRSGHVNFAQSTEVIAPLTEEEKKEKLAELRAKAAAKKAAGSDQDRLDRIANENIRRKATAESQDIKEDLARKQQIKEAQEKRREQQADKTHKNVILQRIAADKAERKRKQDAERALRAGVAPPLPEAPAPVQAPRSAANFTEATLLLRIAGRAPITKKVDAETTLAEVAFQLREEIGEEVSKFQINLPKKTWDQTDFGMTVREAGWVPRTALMVS